MVRERLLVPPPFIIFPREMANYKGIQDKSVNRVEKLDDLKIFNYQEKGWKLHLEIVSESECKIFHLIEKGPPGKDRAEGSTLPPHFGSP